MEMIWVWLAVVAVSLIVEFFTWDLTSIWFAVAGLVSLILSAIDGINWVWQLGVFIVISAVLIIFVRQICKKLLLKSDEKTNVDAFIGKRTKLVTGISDADHLGTVKFNGITWSALAENGKALESGAEVEIVRVDGNKMIVKGVEVANKTDENSVKVEDATKSIENKNQVVEPDATSTEARVVDAVDKKEENK